MAKRKLNVALIGYQFMGKAHSNAWRQAGRFFDLPADPILKVLCGRNEAKGRAAMERLGWEEFDTDWRRVIERPDIDIVDIGTPNDSHAAIAQAALAAGKHVLCEKPLAITLDDARASFEAARASGKVNGICHNYRKAPAIAYAEQLVREGRIGAIRHFRGAYLQDWILDPGVPLVWRLDKRIAGSGSNGDLNAHLIDTARFMLGTEFTEVSGMSETFIRKRPLLADTEGGLAGFTASGELGDVTVDDVTAFLARFQSGATGTFEATRLAPGRKNYKRWEVNGEKGSIAFNLERMNEFELYLADDPQGTQGFHLVQATESFMPYMQAYWPVSHILGYEHTFVNMMKDFVDAVASGGRFSPDFQDGYRNQAVLAAVDASCASRQWEQVER
ncbi:MAG: Gfo/Idh/MocA family oxidoreductase [Armatimonadetes bacterium]|nr:Gfo/Idh/MocA family oxidoreductase [Armatimonadota bacterium]MDE2206528.1 Gfo/Idh/MocA family oxidoreductase [Armatimonadota bacterium]